MPAHGKRRALGQHFLRDQSVIARIVDRTFEEAHAAGCPLLLEVGPGKGALTDKLLDRIATERDGIGTSGRAAGVSRLILAERDRDLAAEWKARAERTPYLTVEPGDFMELPRERWLSELPLGVVSNLPYSAGTAIVTRLAAEPESIPFMVLMFQAEVARRLRAEPDSKAWGSLSVWIQNRWDVTRLCAVPPGAFAPPPDVDSEVVVLKRRTAPRIAVSPHQETLWEGLLKASFAHRRKMLRSCLPPGIHREALEHSGVPGTLRAEALSWEDWDKLFHAAVAVQKAKGC